MVRIRSNVFPGTMATASGLAVAGATWSKLGPFEKIPKPGLDLRITCPRYFAGDAIAKSEHSRMQASEQCDIISVAMGNGVILQKESNVNGARSAFAIGYNRKYTLRKGYFSDTSHQRKNKWEKQQLSVKRTQ